MQSWNPAWIISFFLLLSCTGRAQDEDGRTEPTAAAGGATDVVGGLREAGGAGEAPGDGRERLLSLRREIARHDELYFRKNAPVISDAEYDRLKRELRALEARFDPSGGDDAGAAVAGAGVAGDDRSGVFETGLHRVPMGGLAKAYSDEELGAFHARAAARLGSEEIVYRVEPKYDGLAVSLTYENGRLVRALTRGNGREGDDITAELRARLGGFVGRLDGAGVPAVCELRGEVFLTWAEFARINADREAVGEAVFSHPRTLAVGLVRRREGAGADGGLPEAGDRESGDERRSLSWVAYGWGAWEPEESRPATLAELRERLSAWRRRGWRRGRTSCALRWPPCGMRARAEDFRPTGW